jgi:circadian clock protein KaiC
MGDHQTYETAGSGNGTEVPQGQTLAKTPTHIQGLDEILEGGLPRGRTSVVSGGPGSGKTLLGVEFLYRGTLAGEPGIFVGFEEPLEHLRQNAATLGWDLAGAEENHLLALVDGRIPPDTLISGDFSLKGLLASISGMTRDMGARRIVIDALEVVLRLYDSPRQVRNELHFFNDWLRSEGLTAVLTIRPPVSGSVASFQDFFDSMGDCVLRMDARVENQLSKRRIRVVKYRGSGFGSNEYPYVITGKGLHIAPISTVELRHKALGEKMSTGIDRLDEMLNGGYRRASCVLFAGLPGAGKTMLASTFANAACGRDERVLYVGYEESEAEMIGNLQGVGLHLRPHVESNRLQFLTVMPEAMGPEEHLMRVMMRIDTFDPHHLIVDAISACVRMGGKQAAFDFLVRLINACKERGITVILLNQLSGVTSHMEISGNDVSSIIDTVLFLSYVEGAGEINRIIQVLKARGSGHSNQRQEFVITGDGIGILEPYTGEGEVLTGAARKAREARDAVETERLALDIKAKELELERLRLMHQEIASRRRRQAEMRRTDPEKGGKS